MDILWLSGWLLFGLAASAFFSGIETGLISLNRLRIRHEAERRDRRAVILNAFIENSERLLGTTLAGTNVCNVLVAVCSAALAGTLFGESLTVDLSTTLVSAAIVLVIGETVPKLLFRQYSYRLCRTFADLLNGVAWLLAPLVSVLGLLMRALAHAGRRTEKPPSFFVTREELKHLARESEAGGGLTAEERQMIHGVFDFPHKTIHEVMVPMSRAVTVTLDTDLKELFNISQRTGYARFPVREGDKITGIANVYEVLFEDAPADTRTVRDVMHPPQFVMATDRINRVLPVLRASRRPISIVINAEGRHLGIVTIEDIVEEIVGDVEG